MPGLSGIPRFEIPAELRRIGETIAGAGGSPLLVGGWVRDRLLGIPLGKDFDVEVFGLHLERLRRLLSPFGHVILVGRHFGVLKLNTEEAEYDISVPRRESNIGKGHKGFKVETDPTMNFEEAASRRDFTINAIGYAFLEGKLLDPHGGRRHLEARSLRHVGPAFGEDPLRVLRAMQFAARFGLRIEEDTLAMCRSLDLSELPNERIWEEVKKLLLLSPRPSTGLEYAEALGVLEAFPELRALHLAPLLKICGGVADPTPWRLTLAMTDRAAALRTGEGKEDLVLMTAALCHRMAPALEAPPRDAPAESPSPETQAMSFLGRLTNESGFLVAVSALLADLETTQRLHDQYGPAPGESSAGCPGEIRRLALRLPVPLSIPFLLRAARARHDALQGNGASHADPALHGEREFPAGAWLESAARKLGVWDAKPEPLLQGRHLIKQGMPPSPAMGEVVQQAFERQLDGSIVTLEEALKWALENASGQRAESGQESRPPQPQSTKPRSIKPRNIKPPPGKPAGRGR